MSLAPGAKLAQYEVLSAIGEGGMGEVYKAKDHKLGRTVAIKVLQKDLVSDPERLKRFEQEARAASAGIWRIPIDGGEEVQVLESVRWGEWAGYEQGICYLNSEVEPGPAIELFEFATEQVTRVAALDATSLGSGFSVSPDGRWILFGQIERESDIMLVENFR